MKNSSNISANSPRSARRSIKIPDSALKPQNQVKNELGGKNRRNTRKDSENIKLSMKDFKWVRDLGTGSYGVVSLVELQGNLYALK